MNSTTNSNYNASLGILTSYRFTWGEADRYLAQINAANYGGYSDWRMPTIKELVSIIEYIGNSPTDTYFMDETVFSVIKNVAGTAGYHSGLGVSDMQVWSSTRYVGCAMYSQEMYMFYNVVDGHLKCATTGRSCTATGYPGMGGLKNAFLPVRSDNNAYGVSV